nr:RNA-directed DNA polymerase, eukaryota, nucleotide-binding alpha-beta plait domain protein [Tanacetum cinerariifolium]
VEESDSDVVSDTYFGDNGEDQGLEHQYGKSSNAKEEGGSILEILEEMITVGQTLGFSMECCTKDIEKIIGTQGEQVVFR